jgi:hypothetical protein
MKITNVMIILLVISLIFLAYENQSKTDFSEENYFKPMGGETKRLILNLSSDKEIYHSSEEMELTTIIKTSTKLENLTVKVYGINDRGGSFRVSGERIVNIDPPGTTETFEFRMPSCYGCAGISPGEYKITMEIIQKGEIIGNYSKTVKLEK